MEKSSNMPKSIDIKGTINSLESIQKGLDACIRQKENLPKQWFICLLKWKLELIRQLE